MKYISIFLCLLMSTVLFAQDDFEGTIINKIEYEDLAEEMAAMKSMLPAESVTEIKEGMAKTVTNSPMSNTTVISDTESGAILMLQSTMGNNIAIRMNQEEIAKEQESKNVEVEYTEESKEILGYQCKKAIVTTDGIDTEIYYTKELPSFSTNGQPNGIDGFPMQTIVSNDYFTMTSTVSEIRKEKVKKIKMEVPSDYKEMTMEELKKMQGGM